MGADEMLYSSQELARTKVTLLAEDEQKRRQEAYETHVAAREVLLQDELDRLDPRDGQVVARMMDGSPEAFYHDADLEVVMASRAIGEQAKAQRQAIDAFRISAAIGEEIEEGRRTGVILERRRACSVGG